jgi:hypothetical protein
MRGLGRERALMNEGAPLLETRRACCLCAATAARSLARREAAAPVHDRTLARPLLDAPRRPGARPDPLPRRGAHTDGLRCHHEGAHAAPDVCLLPPRQLVGQVPQLRQLGECGAVRFVWTMGA